jgi:hypothetical protein
MQGYVVGATNYFHLITADVRRSDANQSQRRCAILPSIDSNRRFLGVVHCSLGMLPVNKEGPELWKCMLREILTSHAQTCVLGTVPVHALIAANDEFAH